MNKPLKEIEIQHSTNTKERISVHKYHTFLPFPANDRWWLGTYYVAYSILFVKGKSTPVKCTFMNKEEFVKWSLKN